MQECCILVVERAVVFEHRVVAVGLFWIRWTAPCQNRNTDPISYVRSVMHGEDYIRSWNLDLLEGWSLEHLDVAHTIDPHTFHLCLSFGGYVSI